MGIRGITENVILAAAMTNEFTSFWANRMNIAAAEILITPKNKTIIFTLLLFDACFKFYSQKLIIAVAR
jgi:hypothetical protein